MCERRANKTKRCAILLAAGSSTRMGANKLLFTFGGKTPIELCCEAFAPCVDEIVLAVSDDTAEAAHYAAEKTGVPFRIVRGGKNRQTSVYNALIAADADTVAVHDCARCLVTRDIIEESLHDAEEFGSGIASIRPVDTMRNEADGTIVDRDKLLAAQTPQSFSKTLLMSAYETVEPGTVVTDDAALLLAAGIKPHYSRGSRLNLKLTVPEDVPIFEALLGIAAEKHAEKNKGENAMHPRIGFGEDTHRLAKDRKLILGGAEVPFELGLLGHSDADVLTHAVIDAVLGACALGDIGQHFPDSDPRYKGINSLLLAEHTAAFVRQAGFGIVNIDAVIIAQRPKLAAFRDAMRENLARAFGIDIGSVSVKFTTPEHTGPEGRGESMTARAAALVTELPKNE